MEQQKRRKSKRRRRKQIQRIRICISIVFVGLIVILGGMYLVLDRYVSKYPDNKVVSNIYIGGLDVQNMTKEQVKKALEAHLEEKKLTKVTLLVDGNKEKVTLEDLGFSYKDLDQVVNEAYSYGKDGSIWERYRALKAITKEAFVVEENYVVDDELTKALLEEKAVPLANHAVDASIQRTYSGFNVIEEKEGKTVNIEETIASIIKYLNNEWDYRDFQYTVVLKK